MSIKSKNIFKLKHWLVGLILFGFICFLWSGLHKKPILNNAMAQVQQFPYFNLSEIREENKQITLNDIKGRPFVVHLWASWCGICMKEHPFWVDMQKKYHFPLVGILYRDKPQKIVRFLSTREDPYLYLLGDPSGAVGLDLGIAGIPATFVVDAQGKICYVHFGQTTRSEFEKKILPFLQG